MSTALLAAPLRAQRLPQTDRDGHGQEQESHEKHAGAQRRSPAGFRPDDHSQLGGPEEDHEQPDDGQHSAACERPVEASFLHAPGTLRRLKKAREPRSFKQE